MSEPKFKVGDRVVFDIDKKRRAFGTIAQVLRSYTQEGKEIGNFSYLISSYPGEFERTEEELSYGFNRTASESEKPSPRQCYVTIVSKLRQIYESKNAAYGDSFTQTYQKYGITALLIQLTHKMNRLDTLTRKPDIIPADESVKDTLYDLANYAIMGLAEIEKEKK